MTGCKPDPASSTSGIRRGAVGVLSRDDRFLMIRRASGVVRAGYWCFPGGHLEPGETSRAAIRRELREELGIDVIPLRRLGAVRLLDAGYVLAVWEVRHVGGELRIAEDEVSEAEWFTPAQIRAIRPSLSSNLDVLDLLDV